MALSGWLSETWMDSLRERLPRFLRSWISSFSSFSGWTSSGWSMILVSAGRDEGLAGSGRYSVFGPALDGPGGTVLEPREGPAACGVALFPAAGRELAWAFLAGSGAGSCFTMAAIGPGTVGLFRIHQEAVPMPSKKRAARPIHRP